MANYSEAMAHYNQLLKLGVEENDALRDTQVVFDLLPHEVDFLIDPMAYYHHASDLDAEYYASA